MLQALAQPPPGNSSGKVVAFFFRSPDENRNHISSPDASCKGWVVLYSKVSSEPHYADVVVYCVSAIRAAYRRHDWQSGRRGKKQILREESGEARSGEMGEKKNQILESRKSQNSELKLSKEGQ